MTLSCSVQPAQSAPTCSFSPNPAPFNAEGTATATLTIQTGTTFTARGDPRLQFLWLPIAAFAFTGAGLGFKPWQRRKLAACVLGGLFLGGLLFQPACGSSSKSLPAPVTYTITVTGTSGVNQHSATATLTVQ